MPLLPGSGVAVEPEEVITAPTVPYLETVGKPAFTWIDPDGGIWPLSNTSESLGWFTLTAIAGAESAPIEITSDALSRGGSRVRAIARRSSTIQWPMEIFGRTHDEFVARYRQISRAFKLTTLRQRPGWLRVRRPDGSARQIQAFYSEGLGGEAEQNHLFARPVISLFCPDGKWQALDPVIADRTFAATPGPGVDPVNFYDPFISVASSNEVTPVPDPGDGPDSTTVIVNPGDVEAWPVWTVTGPLTALRTWNLTLESRFALTYTLTAGQTITIITEPPSVRGPGDTNLIKHIDWFNSTGTELWPLADGENVIGLEVDGAGTGTAVRLAFVPRYDNS